jgi:hypothetical protein
VNVAAQFRRILGRRQAYRALFRLDEQGRPQGEDAQRVLADLRRFCRADQPTIVVNPITRSVDPVAMALAEGRREVWLRLQAHLRMSDADIAQLQDHNEALSE